MVANAIVKVLELFQKDSHVGQERRHSALEALQIASTATRTYEALVATEAGILDSTKRDLAEEKRIGGLWHSAAISISELDPRFGEILYSKSLYWMNEFHFDAEQVLKLGIDWKSIENMTLELLRN